MSDLDVIKEIEKSIGKHLSTRRIDLVWMNENSCSLNENQELVALNLRSRLDDISFLKNCTNLKILSLYGNELENINILNKLKLLTSLYLNNNKITNLNALKELQNLTKLDLSYNFITDIDSLKELTNLELLNLNHNSIIYFSSLKEFKKLIQLDLSYNKITDLPAWIIDLGLEIKWSSLEEGLCIEGNPVCLPPLEIIKCGNEAIFSYFQQLKQGVDYLYEAKLILVGEGGAGKTSLANKIINPAYQLSAEHQSLSTQGIDVLHYNFFYKNKILQANIWDFGGQEIYHQTHQFFLSKRSLYLLLADNRKEDSDFYYWLNTVSLLSDNSPLLIIKNEKQNRIREIHEAQLKADFSNIKDILSTNLSDNRGLSSIIDSLHYHLSQLPHIGSTLPKTWVKVRRQLEQSNLYTIDLKYYFKICQENGFEKNIDKLQLSSYLHDLGVCLHFQDDDLLRKILILKPNWATNAVYKVLDNSKVIHNFGCFNKEDLAVIWQESQYNELHDELLSLMKKFKLCYEIPNQPHYYIAPQLLKLNPPNYCWDANNNLVLRYQYNFMPKGILSQFIVMMHCYIANNYQWVWKSGVILEKDKTQAEIIEYYGKREIHIRIHGNNKKELLNIVSYELDKINSSYERLKDKCKKLIPCNCEKCLSLEESHFYDYSKLKERIAHRKYTIECGNPPYADVNILKLIEGLDLTGLSDKIDKNNPQFNFKDCSFNNSDFIKNEENKMSGIHIGGNITGGNIADGDITMTNNSRNFNGNATNSNVNLGNDSVQTNTITQSNESGNQTQNKPAETKEDSLFKKLGFYALVFAFVYSSLAAVLAYDLQKDGKVGNKTYKEIVSLPITVIADLFKDEKKEGK